MVDSKSCAGVGPWLQVIIILAVLLVEPLDQAHIGGLRELGLLIYQCEDIHWFLSNHVESCLIVNKSNFLPADSLLAVLFLFHFEDMLHKELLEVFVCIIDTKLFKTVVLKILKSENIQNSDCTFVSANFSFENCAVDFLDALF